MTDRSILDLWPGNALWSSQVVRLAALSYSRGADLSEVVSTVAGIRSGDSDGWYKAFDDLANRTRWKSIQFILWATTGALSSDGSSLPGIRTS